jgi:hypothetical protein
MTRSRLMRSKHSTSFWRSSGRTTPSGDYDLTNQPPNDHPTNHI